MSENPQEETTIEKPLIFKLPQPITSALFISLETDKIIWMCATTTAAEELLKWVDLSRGAMVYNFADGQVRIYCRETEESIIEIYKEFIDEEVDKIDPQIANDIEKTKASYEKRMEGRRRGKTS